MNRKATPAERAKWLRFMPEHTVWRGMIQRCHNPNDKNFHNYGGRGIVVCRRWRTSFAAFLSDVGRRPSARHELERVRNSEPYRPSNCEWTTRRAQTRNMRTNRVIEIGGRRKPLCDWAEESGVNYGTIRTRLRNGWPVKRAIFEPARTMDNTYRGISS